MSKPRSAAGAARVTEESNSVSVVRTGLALLLFLGGIGYIWYYTFTVYDDQKPAWIADLGGWNWVVGFGLLFVGMMLGADRRTPLGRGRGIVIGMLASFLIGLAWIVVYYLTSQNPDVPLLSALGNYNLLVGIGFMGVGFVYATHWE